MLKQVLQFVTLLVFASAASLSMAQRTPLLVYTALETDQLKAFKDSIESILEWSKTRPLLGDAPQGEAKMSKEACEKLRALGYLD